MKREEQQYKQFIKWFENRTPEESQLYFMVIDFDERYFTDLRLTEKNAERLLSYEVQADDGKWEKVIDDPPLFIGINPGNWIFRFCRFRDDTIGRCHRKHRIIQIRPGLNEKEHKSTVLHEMIHAYEMMLPEIYREWLLLELDKKLARKITRKHLNDCIDVSLHVITHHRHYHGLFFLFKSLDLDLRLRWPLGTVFGYGQDEFFS